MSVFCAKNTKSMLFVVLANTLCPGAVFSEEAIPSECVSVNFDAGSSNIDNKVGDLIGLSEEAQFNGERDVALKCALTLLEITQKNSIFTFGDRVEAVLLLSDISKKQNFPIEILDVYIYGLGQFPDKDEGSESELAMISTSLSDYFYITHDPRAYYAYRALVEMGECNTLISFGLDICRRRRDESGAWVDVSDSMELDIKDCPDSVYFLNLAKTGG